jgi:hypothetical protein
MPTSSQAEKERKRYIVAVGVISGKSRAVIVQEAGCQARHVRRLAQDLPTRLLISELLRPYQLRLPAVWSWVKAQSDPSEFQIPICQAGIQPTTGPGRCLIPITRNPPS